MVGGMAMGEEGGGGRGGGGAVRYAPGRGLDTSQGKSVGDSRRGSNGCREAAVVGAVEEFWKRVGGMAVEGEVALIDGADRGRRTGTRRRIGMGTE